ncbi:TonB-dependent siderophore receptor [Rhizobium sp. CSW-27]|uniref:TonB-dependent receptor n=1 Tax=Rhizobium sp. CSW-27 TaxID=2839985 RepID=UPI001C032D57|nr:TonB-dependent siderophore receptor [Rhizobium sp. CSW-27]MBT9370154.1 TonB-dependent siderophore receptor [Rhizobium sp. CSW-27]
MLQERTVVPLRPLISGAAATAGLAMSLTSLPTLAQAQTTTTAKPKPQEAEGDETVLDRVAVEGQSSGNTNGATTGISRLPASVRETPRTINVVPAEIIEEQRATTLEQALRNVPGITLSTGEGNGGQNGSQFRIRGFQARSDVYVDGLRDFGVYARDTFNTEDIQVFKGPSGDNFGAGNTGGLINQQSKKAKLENFTKIDQSVGSGPTYRTTLDTNYKIDDTTAIRVNGLFHKQDVADRDHVTADRRGVAIDLGMGIDTETEWHLSYSYLHGDGIPDYGQPMVQGADGIYLPAAEYGFDPSISYVRSTNQDVTNNHMLGSSLKSEVNDWLTLTNDTRVTFYSRDFGGTVPGSCADSSTSTCATDFFSGNTSATFGLGAGGGLTYKQDGWAIQNVTAAHMDFDTGSVAHKAVVGLDVSYQHDERVNGSWTGWTNRNRESLFNPQYYYNFTPTYDYAAKRTLESTNIGLFVSDRAYLTDTFSVLGGLRLDYLKTEMTQSGAFADESDTSLNPSIGVIWEPSKTVALYASFARTHKPASTDIAALTGNASELPSETAPLKPEVSDTFEIGGKADFLDGRLGLTAALFQVDKDNSYNEITGLPAGAGDASTGRRVRGVEIGVSGKITDAWSVLANYAYMDSEITASSTAAQIGKEAPNVSHHNVNLWTTYTLFDELSAELPGKVTVGGGIVYASSYWLDASNVQKIPESFSLDAMVAYQTDKFRMSLNGYNLTDHQNYQSGMSGRAVPASGPTVMFNIGTTF